MPEKDGRVQRRRAAAQLPGIDRRARSQEPGHGVAIPVAAADQMSAVVAAFVPAGRRVAPPRSNLGPSVKQYSLEAVRISSLSPATAGTAKHSSSRLFRSVISNSGSGFDDIGQAIFAQEEQPPAVRPRRRGERARRENRGLSYTSLPVFASWQVRKPRSYSVYRQSPYTI